MLVIRRRRSETRSSTSLYPSSAKRRVTLLSCSKSSSRGWGLGPAGENDRDDVTRSGRGRAEVVRQGGGENAAERKAPLNVDRLFLGGGHCIAPTFLEDALSEPQ